MTTSWRIASGSPRTNIGIVDTVSSMPRSPASGSMVLADGVLDLLADVEHDALVGPGVLVAAGQREQRVDEFGSRSDSRTISCSLVLSGWSTWRYSAFARITASGVRSSCDASATNVR